MSMGIIKKICSLESAVLHLHRKNEVNSEVARTFYDKINTLQEELSQSQSVFLESYSDDYEFDSFNEEVLQYNFNLAEFAHKKITRMLEILKRFLEPVESTSPKTALESLLKKQEFYVQMIDSLAPEGEISSKEAELQYDHVSRYYDKFIANQSEIMTLVEDSASNDQVNFSKEIHRKVLSIQKSLNEIFLPSKPSVSSELKKNEHVAVDLLDSEYKKQKSLIEQIESIESKKNLSAVEAETLHSHLSQLHGSFIQNQTKIESCMTGAALDKELEFSRKIVEKVMFLQTKLKEIFASIKTQSSNDCNLKEKTEEMSETDKAARLIPLIEKQTSLINEIESLKSFDQLYQPYLHKFSSDVSYWDSNYYSSNYEVKSSLKNLLELKTWFISNQTNIEKLVSDYDLRKQKEISENIQSKVTKLHKEYEFYIAFYEYLEILRFRSIIANENT